MIYNKFINCSTLDIFNQRKEAGDITEQHIVFIQDAKQIWTGGVFYAAPELDPSDLSKVNEIIDKIVIDGNGDKFLTDNGNYVAISNISVGTANKLGTSTVGSGTKPIYLSSGSPVASGSTVGTSGRPVYMNSGNITQCGDTLNVNISGNAATATNATHASSADKIGSSGGSASTIGSNTKPVYVNNGTITALSSTVGSSTVPVYMSGGSITKCSTTLGVSITGNAATATYVTRDRGVNTVTTLTSLPVTKSLVTATLSGATSISLASNMNVGESITVICTPNADFTQPIPNSGNFLSMDGDSLKVTSGKQFEMNICCYATGKYSISSKIKR